MAKQVYSLIIIHLNNPNMEVVYHYNGCYEYTLGDIHNMVVMGKSFCFDKI